jgi:hypothetical protein
MTVASGAGDSEEEVEGEPSIRCLKSWTKESKIHSEDKGELPVESEQEKE